jgi:hypothetical protein
MPEPAPIAVARISPPPIVTAPTRDAAPFSPSPLPIPVPPDTEIEPFTTVTDPHEPFAQAPIPTALASPTADSEPRPTACTVTFASPTHPSPAAPAPSETAAFALAATTVTVLRETVIAAVALTDAPRSQITALASETWMEFVKKVPITTNSVTSDSFTLQYRDRPDSAMGAAVILQLAIQSIQTTHELRGGGEAMSMSLCYITERQFFKSECFIQFLRSADLKPRR